MPIVNRIGDFAAEMTEWRHWLHRNPELGYACHKTAAFVADKLRGFGVDAVHEGIATTGIVAIVEGQGPGPTIGLRADMDALPIAEATGAAHVSETPGVMHACGHDGHTAMLLGAAKYLAETRRFAGRVALIFQPAEEDGGGGDAMVRAGIMDRFGITRVFALHTGPGLAEGQFFTTPGPIMAAVDEFTVTVTGQGGHAAHPYEAADPIPAVLAMAQAVPTIVSRNNKALDDLVVSVTHVHAGTAYNVIPGTAWFGGTIRTFDEPVRQMVFRRLRQIVAGHAPAFGVEAELRIDEGYPATVNSPDETAFAASVAAEIAGAAGVSTDAGREMGAEDFSYMLNVRPGAYLFLGQGEGPYVHHPAFDFNDRVAPVGASFFARLVERAQPPGMAAE